MPIFKVKHSIQKDDVTYPVGSEIELTVDEARNLSEVLENPPLPPAPKDKQLAKALASQANRPQPHNQAWQRDAETVTAEMKRARSLAEAKPEKAEPEKTEEPEKPEKPEDPTDTKK